jgi:putative transposase
MNEQTIRKTYQHKLKPISEQEGTMEFVTPRCCEPYNAALQERKDAWQKRGVSVTVAGQSAQLLEVKDICPEYRDIHSQVLQDALTQLDRAFQELLRRVRNGETPGYPRFQGPTATTVSPTRQPNRATFGSFLSHFARILYEASVIA